MKEAVRVLYVYDESAAEHPDGECLAEASKRIEINAVQTVNQALNSIESEAFDCVLCTQDLSDEDGITLLRRLRDRDLKIPFVLYVSDGSEQLASEAISAGVTEYIRASPEADRKETIVNRVEDAVREHSNHSTYKISELTEATDDVLWLISADWDRLLYVNSAYASIWGQEEATLQNDPSAFLDAVHPDDRPTAEAAMQRLTEGDSVEVELRVNTQEDYQRRVLVQAEPIYGSNGSVQRIAGASREVTRQRAQQQRLEEEKRMTDSIFSAIPDVLYTFDTAGYLLRWNDQLERETGYTSAEIADMHVTDFVPEDEVEPILDSFQAVISDHETVTVESAFESTDGQRIPFEFTGGPIEDSDGDLRGVTGVGRNISDRKRQQRRYKAVFNNTYQFTGLMSTDGTLLEVNQTAADFANLPRDELTGEKIWEAHWFQATETAQQVARQSVETASDGEFFREQITVQGADGEVVIDFSVRPVTNERGAVDLLVPEGRDITRLSEREQQLEVTNRFLRHNLRNKLNVIQGYADLISEADTDIFQSYGAPIVDTADELNGMSEMAREIHDLIETDPEPEPIDLSEQIDKAVSLARNRSPQANISTDISHSHEVMSIPTIYEGFAELFARMPEGDERNQPAITTEVVQSDIVAVVIPRLGESLSAVEQEVLTGDIEIETTRHAQGLAVWYVYWQLWYSGGEIRVLADNQRVEIHLPTYGDTNQTGLE